MKPFVIGVMRSSVALTTHCGESWNPRRRTWVRRGHSENSTTYRPSGQSPRAIDDEEHSSLRERQILLFATHTADEMDWKRGKEHFAALNERWNVAEPVPKGIVDEMWQRFQNAQHRFKGLNSVFFEECRQQERRWAVSFPAHARGLRHIEVSLVVVPSFF